MRIHIQRFIPALLVMAVSAAVVWGAEVSERRIALRALSQRAASGDAKALYDLATLHDTGYDSIPVDSARSSVLYRLSAEKGYAPARNYLGFRYFNGEFLQQNIDSAMYWITRAAADGDPKAANNLGFLLSNSDVVSRDYPQAVYWLSKAADAGIATSQSLLADLLRQGLGTETDTIRAVELYNRAIQSGLRDAELKLLSMMGPSWETLSPDSALSLGRYYYNHRAPFIGVTLFENAAASDDADALALLGDAYSRAVGVDYDHEKSLYFFLRGALLGNPSAQFVIGELLDIFPDALEGAEPQALLNELLDYIPDDIYTAPFWYELAAEAGVTTAEEAADRLLFP